MPLKSGYSRKAWIQLEAKWGVLPPWYLILPSSLGNAEWFSDYRFRLIRISYIDGKSENEQLSWNNFFNRYTVKTFLKLSNIFVLISRPFSNLEFKKSHFPYRISHENEIAHQMHFAKSHENIFFRSKDIFLALQTFMK